MERPIKRYEFVDCIAHALGLPAMTGPKVRTKIEARVKALARVQRIPATKESDPDIRSGYTLTQVNQVVVAFALMEAGMNPEEAAAILLRAGELERAAILVATPDGAGGHVVKLHGDRQSAAIGIVSVLVDVAAITASVAAWPTNPNRPSAARSGRP